ncbi:MAG: phenylalanine--tRNA ligase subunit beta [Clostridia bacterium]
MKISLNWIKDYVDLEGLSTDEIVTRLGLATCEIEEVIKRGDDMDKVVFAKILKVKEHPCSKKLHILEVDSGEELLQIVCGAPNVYEGMVTALVRIGGKVSGNKISKAKLGGEESFGMCCSEAELGIGSDDDGIIDIHEDVVIGQDIKEYFPINDTIIDIDNKSLTNRPDLWCNYGFARELSAIFNRELKPLPVVELKNFDGLQKIKININTDACQRYSAISVENISIKKSPMIMKIRLNYSGIRDINFLADVTNYVMLEMGQPMHAFDNEAVKGINVNNSNGKIEMLTLENAVHIVPENTVVICDENDKAVAIAGIKGGLRASINEETSSVLFESATFDSVTIRKSSRKIGLSTDASQRYEKTLDPCNTEIALARVLEIIKNVDKNIVVTSCFSDNFPKPYSEKIIKVAPSFIINRLGIDIDTKFMKDKLQRLGFEIDDKNDEWLIKVPSFRATKDVGIKEDLVEEVGRMYGYDNIQPQPLNYKLQTVAQIPEHVLEFKVKRLLAEKYGTTEVHSYIWNYTDFNKLHGIESESFISLTDSSNSGQSGIRSKIVPSLLKFVDENKNNLSDIRILEIGRVVAGKDENNMAKEEKKLGVVIASEKSDESVYFELKKIIENINSSLIYCDVSFKPCDADSNYMHPVNSSSIIVNNKKIGEMGLLHPSVNKLIDKKKTIGVIELDFTKLVCNERVDKKVRIPSKYQSVSIDFNFLIPLKMTYAEVMDIIMQYKNKFIQSIQLKDVYENNEVLCDNKSMTFEFVISSSDHTLTSEEIDKFTNKILEHMKKNNIILR